MNQFVCVGRIVDVKENGKHLKFTVSTWQKKPKLIPCVIFSPKSEDVEYIKSLPSSKLIVWVQGWMVNYDINVHGTKLTTIEVATSLYNIKEI